MCIWQRFTNIADHYFLPMFVLAIISILVLALIDIAADRELSKAGKPSKSEGLTDREMRSTSFAWFVPVRRVLLVLLILTFAYPLLSPTFCLNLKCGSDFGWLKPLTSCNPGEITMRLGWINENAS